MGLVGLACTSVCIPYLTFVLFSEWSKRQFQCKSSLTYLDARLGTYLLLGYHVLSLAFSVATLLTIGYVHIATSPWLSITQIVDYLVWLCSQ